MPTSLTLHNLPDDLYKRLLSTADKNRRSVNCEAIACLEYALNRRRIPAAAHLAGIRVIMEGVDTARFSAEDIDAFKWAGRA